MAYKIKTLDEEFYNPYDEEEKAGKAKKKKPVRISGDGGLLKPRREIFNINRVAYSKRPNAEFTVMAKTQFAKGEIIEIAPIIFVGVEAKAVNRLKDFIFEIEKDGKNGGMYGLVLGYGSLYKHSDEPNVEYAYNRSNRQMYFKAARVIQAHEELSINYGRDYWEERAMFGTLAGKNETQPSSLDPDVDEVDEGLGLQPNADTVTGELQTKANSSPNSGGPDDGRNRMNPAMSGIALKTGNSAGF
jgi:hypothetical protein